MTTSPPELSEKDFIQEEGYRKNPFPFWLWLFLLTTAIALLWGGNRWYGSKMNLLFQESPFLQVTNREMSLFLWQNPEFMRINAKQKNGYLPGFFYTDTVTMELPSADHYVSSPPDLLFRYHTWHRLVSNEFTERSIDRGEFREFLSQVPEWQPTYWPQASQEFIHMIEELSSSHVDDLATLPISVLPKSVRMAFQGWKNYFKEGEAINQVKPTLSEMRKFLSKYPHYARNYWRNIVEHSNPDYLKVLSSGNEGGNTIIPATEMASFLKVAIYNYLEAQKGVSSK